MECNIQLLGCLTSAAPPITVHNYWPGLVSYQLLRGGQPSTTLPPRHKQPSQAGTTTHLRAYKMNFCDLTIGSSFAFRRQHRVKDPLFISLLVVSLSCAVIAAYQNKHQATCAASKCCNDLTDGVGDSDRLTTLPSVDLNKYKSTWTMRFSNVLTIL